MRLIIVSTIATIGLLGCLSEQGRVFDADAQSEVDGTTPDGTTPDGTIGPDGETSNPCDNVVCDDNDDCTFDQCNPETGACEYLGVPGTGGGAAVPAQCSDNAGCEDGDPCTDNACVFVGCGAGSYCTSDPVPGCGTSCATTCVDDDPCTRDVCRADICYHIAQQGCDAECVTGPLYGVEEVIIGANAGMPSVKATGLLTFDPRKQSCDEGPLCGCQGYAQLSDGGFGLFLRDQGTGAALDPWTCSSTGCIDPFVTCDPAHADVRYRVWGRAIYEGDEDDADGIARYSGVAVDGFCLETQGTALVGKYEGQLVFANYEVTFDAAIRPNNSLNSELRLTFGNAVCQACTLDSLPEGDVLLTPGSGFADFEATLPSIAGPTQHYVRLYSNRNTLTGEYGGFAGSNFVAPLPGGTITLTRLAP